MTGSGERNRQVLQDLMRRPGNDVCADCKCSDPEWASCNLGIFLCQDCASIHRGLGVEISRVKSVKLDNWDDEQVKRMAEQGNQRVNEKYEQHLPPFYKRPTKDDVEVLRHQFIKAKYERKEFIYVDKQSAYTGQAKEGYLMKRGKDDRKFNSRKFILSRQENKISYLKDNGKQKAKFDLDDVNAVFVPDKIGNPNGLQITYTKADGSTRSIYVYCEDPKEGKFSKEIVDWYCAIRAAKLERKRIAFPDRADEELARDLTQDFFCEGYLNKMGPKNEPFRKRWFTLDRRKFMYFSDHLSPFPIREVFIGHQDGGYSVSTGEKSNQGFPFTLITPEREFILSADSREDMDRWINSLQRVIQTPLTPQDTKLASLLNQTKKKNSFKFS